MTGDAGVARAPLPDVTASSEWEDLAAHHLHMAEVDLRGLFDGDPERAARMGRQAGDLYVDFSKHLATEETLDLLVRLAELVGLEQRRDAMFAGEHINTTEDRAVLHVALRMPADATLVVDGQDVIADVHRVLARMGELADQIRSGEWTGATGRRIRTVVNIGIGGSDLGPAMAYQALGDFASPDVACRFVSNVDPLDLWNQTHDLDPAETLFVVCSKTFTTLETMTNAAAARQWVLEGLGLAGDDAARPGDGDADRPGDGDADPSAGAVAKHFIAVSANLAAVATFGIDTHNMLEFWDWVGGRYSFDSAIGFTVMVAIGPDAFGEMLAGFHLVDEHFRTAPLRANVPVLQGLLNVWYRDFFGFQSHAVLPYSQRLARFPAYLQQLTMESNGKSVRRDGTPVQDQTGEVYWGEPGTNGQHAFYQLLHQGTTTVPADFIAFAEPAHDNGDQHHLLMANCFAQSAVLAFGRTADEVAAEGTPPEVVPHKVMPGNRPSSTVLAPRLTPSTLGQLVALYEHTVFTEGAVWGIDSFDQWGVELGKAMASQLVPALVTHDAAESSQLLAARGSDSSTTNLVTRYRDLRG